MSTGRITAIVLLVLGTVIGSLGGARLPEADRAITGVGLALLVVGAILLRLSGRMKTAPPGIAGAKGLALAGSTDEVLEALRAMPARLEALLEEAPGLPLRELTERLSAIATELGEPIATGSPRLLPSLGPARFAEIFGAYASGERALCRAWSAAADLHRPEALASLRTGSERVRAAVAELDGPATGEGGEEPEAAAG